MNAGATVDSSVVWSPKSFVPRSANLDLTLDVFGQAVNLFEVSCFATEPQKSSCSLREFRRPEVVRFNELQRSANAALGTPPERG